MRYTLTVRVLLVLSLLLMLVGGFTGLMFVEVTGNVLLVVLPWMLFFTCVSRSERSSSDWLFVAAAVLAYFLGVAYQITINPR